MAEEESARSYGAIITIVALLTIVALVYFLFLQNPGGEDGGETNIELSLDDVIPA